MTELQLVVPRRSLIPTGSLWLPPQPIVKRSSRLRFRKRRSVQSETGCQFPLETGARSYFFVSDGGVIQGRIAPDGAELLIHPIARCPNVGTAVKQQAVADFIFQAWRWHHRIERPLRRKFPTNTAPGQ